MFGAGTEGRRNDSLGCGGRSDQNCELHSDSTQTLYFLEPSNWAIGEYWILTELLSSISDRQTGRKEQNCCNGMRPRFRNLNTVTLPLPSS